MNDIANQDYDKVIDYIPVRKKHQLIIRYDYTKNMFIFTDNDKQYLWKITNNKQLVDKTIYSILTTSNYNPSKNVYAKIWKVIWYFLWILIGLFFLYLLLGLIIFFLGDPVICFLYSYFILYQAWYRGGRVGIEYFTESVRAKPLQSFLEKQNKHHYGEYHVKWTVGGNGKWIQVDNEKNRY